MTPASTDVFLHPGQWFAGGPRHRVRTLLGSCVSVVLWHRESRIGAMSHGVMFSRNGALHAGDGYYGTEALDLMLAALAARGIAGAACDAWLVGGGSMFGAEDGQHSPGARHGAAMRALLRSRGIALRGDCLFGRAYRRVVFDVASGALSVCVMPALPLRHAAGNAANSRAALQGLDR